MPGTFEDHSRPMLFATGLFVGVFGGLLWLLTAVTDWVLAVLKAAR